MKTDPGEADCDFMSSVLDQLQSSTHRQGDIVNRRPPSSPATDGLRWMPGSISPIPNESSKKASGETT